VDPKIPIEEAVKTLAELVKEGKFDYIGLSECSAETLRRANAVCSYLGALAPTNCVSRIRIWK
jgi:aryl-alcohol dehydrogenase-like predicted oxidoreductase